MDATQSLPPPDEFEHQNKQNKHKPHNISPLAHEDNNTVFNEPNSTHPLITSEDKNEENNNQNTTNNQIRITLNRDQTNQNFNNNSESYIT